MHYAPHNILKGFRHLKDLAKKGMCGVWYVFEQSIPLLRRSFWAMVDVYGAVGRSVTGPPAKTPDEIRAEQNKEYVTFTATTGEPDRRGDIVRVDGIKEDCDHASTRNGHP